ncbi:LOW QUALITY PROTEIN: hypothetical protein OSB04_002600 [Centaurea solstitialis]|uniref:Uncharacterized protein n=1 Tax=Centaurea solstitialis TaxID=347529 RepID=A0AA38TV35_9ASTR|nr:LOW QUALITY PROTEIN: hypothetical protein OSB04_002600 [Centaurea solstitialis]
MNVVAYFQLDFLVSSFLHQIFLLLFASVCWANSLYFAHFSQVERLHQNIPSTSWSKIGLHTSHPRRLAHIWVGHIRFIWFGLPLAYPKQEPGRAEADFGRLDAKTVVRNIYILFSKSEIAIANENQEIMDLVEPTTPLPSWFTEEDLATYGELYERSGFRTALQVPYRTMHLDVGPTEPDPKVEAPTLLIMGEKDYAMKSTEEYVKSGGMKKHVPNLETIYVPHGSHFVHEQFPDQVNQLILTFLDRNKHRVPA